MAGGKENVRSFQSVHIMTTIHFSPDYSGNLYLVPDAGNVMMDVTAANLPGLVAFLELRLGLHYSFLAPHTRLANYHKALARHIAMNPHSVFARSFAAAGLSTASRLLEWRDKLRLAGWEFSGEEASRRIKELIEVETYFEENPSGDLLDRIERLLTFIHQHDCRFGDLEVIMPCSLDLLPPLAGVVLKTLAANGAALRLLPDAPDNDSDLAFIRRILLASPEDLPPGMKLRGDGSLRVWHFADEFAAGEYLAHNLTDPSMVVINPANRRLDNWLRASGRPLSGSSTGRCAPRITQMLMLGINLFGDPLDLNALVEWLSLPVHPIDGLTRRKLADMIVAKGGYRNDDCRRIVEDYIEGKHVYLDPEQRALPEEEQQKLRNKYKKSRIINARWFLPSPERMQNRLCVADLREFASRLGSWATRQAHFMSERIAASATRDGSRLHPMVVEQLHDVSEMSESLLILLEGVATADIERSVVDAWISTFNRNRSYTHAESEVDSLEVIDSPWKLISIAPEVVWIGVEARRDITPELAFLYPSERERLEAGGYITPFGEDAERRYREYASLAPLLRTSGRLTIVVCATRDCEPTEAHPLLVRLREQIENFSEVAESSPRFDMNELLKVTSVKNYVDAAKIRFLNSSDLRLPSHLSPTVIETLVSYPLDFLMERVLDITSEGRAAMKDLKATQGTVAHAVIAELCTVPEGEPPIDGDALAAAVDTRYESVFERQIEAFGGLLLLTENKLNIGVLHDDLRNCLDVLASILSDNGLHVVATEKQIQHKMGFSLPLSEKDPDRDVLGYVDMLLEDSAGNQVVFDFKWTSGNYYRRLLQNNRSIQLELYGHILHGMTGRPVGRLAYFLMPEGRLLSRSPFKGPHCLLIQDDEDSPGETNLVEKVVNSVEYRLEELRRGELETNGDFNELDYVADTSGHGLLPLELDENTNRKILNRFSNYGHFLK